MTPSTRFLPLGAVRAADAPTAGHKAAALGEALAAGEPVPPGVVLTAACLDAVLRPAGLADDWAAALAAARRGDFAPAAALAPRVAAVAWPPDIVAAVAAAIDGLAPAAPPADDPSPGAAEAAEVPPGPRFAVRSSATAEDAPEASAAGVFRTELEVAEADVPAAASRCWAALLDPAALAHLLALGHDPAAVRLALLVQPMLRPAAAGVLFTLDPTDPDRARMAIAVTAGLGDAVVEGEAGTDHRLPRTGPVRDLPGLPPGAARRLRDLARRVELRAGRPLDLEWAWDAQGPHLLQARPVAGQPAGAHLRAPIRWSRDLAEERFPEPISPLGWSALQPALRVNVAALGRFGLAARRPEEVATAHGAWVYNNRDFFKIPDSLRLKPAAHRPYLWPWLRAVAPVLLSPGDWPLAFAARGGKVASHVRDPRLRAVAGVFEAAIFAHAAAIEAEWTEAFPAHLAAFEALEAEDPLAMDMPARIDYAKRLIAASDAYMAPDMAIYVVKAACRWLAGAIATLAGEPDEAPAIAALTGGLEANATQAMNAELEALTAAVAADAYLAAALRHDDQPALAAAWPASPARARCEAFLRRYGHIGHTWDLREPTWGERPEVLTGLLANRLRAAAAAPRADAAETEAVRLGALRTAREAATGRIAAALAPAPWAPGFFRRLLGVLHAAMRLDEEHHLHAGRLIPAERRLLAAFAADFVATGLLRAPDDVYFLTLDEVLALAADPDPHTRAPLAARRRAAYERSAAARPPAEYLGAVPLAAEAVVPAADGTLRGEAASPGVVEGPVRHVRALADLAAVRRGDVLVVPTPKPSYTPAWGLAGGVIAARGSLLSHGLVLAREYGLPAITGVPDALERLPEGTRVRLDGQAGTVTVLQPQPVS